MPRHSAPDYSICLSDSTAHLILSHHSECRCWKAATTQTRHASSIIHALQHLRWGWRREVGCEMFPKPCLQAAHSVCRQQLCSASPGTRVSPAREPDKVSIRTKGPGSPQPPLPPSVPQAQPARVRGAQGARAAFPVHQRLRARPTEVTVTRDSVSDNSSLGAGAAAVKESGLLFLRRLCSWQPCHMTHNHLQLQLKF